MLKYFEDVCSNSFFRHDYLPELVTLSFSQPEEKLFNSTTTYANF